jgi:hypothetical protein
LLDAPLIIEAIANGKATNTSGNRINSIGAAMTSKNGPARTTIRFAV